MGAKKKGGKKAGKKGKAGGGSGLDALDVNESNAMLEAMQQSLVAKLIRDTDEADKAKASEMEIRVREMGMEKKVKQEKKIQMDIISDMTRQYKSVEERLMDKMVKLEQKKMDNGEETKRLD